MEGLQVYAWSYEECAPNKKTMRLSPPYHMLHFIMSGSGTFNGEVLSGGKAFLCRSHRLSCYTPSHNAPWSYYWLNCSGSMAEKALAECGFSESDVIDFSQTPELLDLLKLAADRYHPEFWEGMFLALMGLLKNQKSELLVTPPQKHIHDAEAIIVSCNGAITPASLAASLGLSRAYLRNLFAEYKSMSVQQYIISYRMARAENLLEETNLPIAEIAAMVGYNDPFLMSKQFRKCYGCSPSEHRKQLSAFVRATDQIFRHDT